MKKLLAISFLFMFMMCSYAEARTQYDSTGRNIVYDGTIRGRKKAAEQARYEQKRIQAAAAARMNYDEMLRSMESNKSKTNSYKQNIIDSDYDIHY